MSGSLFTHLVNHLFLVIQLFFEENRGERGTGRRMAEIAIELLRWLLCSDMSCGFVFLKEEAFSQLHGVDVATVHCPPAAAPVVAAVVEATPLGVGTGCVGGGLSCKERSLFFPAGHRPMVAEVDAPSDAPVCLLWLPY